MHITMYTSPAAGDEAELSLSQDQREDVVVPSGALVASQVQTVVEKYRPQRSTVENALLVLVIFEVRIPTVDHAEDKPPKLCFLMQQYRNQMPDSMIKLHSNSNNITMKKVLGETQTLLHAGCSKAGPKIFAPPQTPFLGAQDGQNLISWRWSLQTQFGEDRCTQFGVIVITDPQTHTHKCTPPIANTQTGLITIHSTAKLARSVLRTEDCLNNVLQEKIWFFFARDGSFTIKLIWQEKIK